MAELSANSKVVLKLELKGDIRRIPLRKLWDSSACTISHQRLLDLTIQYFGSDHELTEQAINFTYTDEDGDTITASSDEELFDAFNQFVNKTPPVVRASVTVRKKKSENSKKESKKLKSFTKSKALPTQEKTEAPGPENSKKESKKLKAFTKSKALPTQKKTEAPGPKQFQHVIETFSTVVGNAVDNLQKQIPRKTDSAQSVTTFSSVAECSNDENSLRKTKSSSAVNPPCVTEVISGTPPCKNQNTAVASSSKSSSIEVKNGDKSNAPKDKVTEQFTDKSNAPKDSVTEQFAEEDVNLRYKATDTVKVSSQEKETFNKNCTQSVPSCYDRTFIHGRHTCDGCLVTPILGIRYHAKNLPDYDLCQKCHRYSEGSHIILEPEELDRDRHMQTRWRRRQNGRNQRNKYMGCRDSNYTSVDIKYPNVDRELNEAIRRSLLGGIKDVVSNLDVESPQVQLKKDLQEKKPNDLTEKENVFNTSGDEGSEGCSNRLPVDNSCGNEVDAREESENSTGGVVNFDKFPEDNAESNKSVNSSGDLSNDIKVLERQENSVYPNSPSTFSEDAEGHGDVALAIGNALDNCAEAIDAIVSEVEQKADLMSSINSLMDKNEDVDSNEGQAILKTENDEVTTADQDASMKKMVKSSIPEKRKEADNSNEDQNNLESPMMEDDMSEEGRTILESEDSKKEEICSVEDEDWQVLGKHDQVANDEMIARAAQMLGSALFMSDMSHSTENTSKTDEDLCKTDETMSDADENASTANTHTGEKKTSTADENFEKSTQYSFKSNELSDARSSVSSVPSSVPSLSFENSIPEILVSRWKDELNQLHELGFYDDRELIEAFESLTAANIGVNSTEKVTVRDVVNYLFNK